MILLVFIVLDAVATGVAFIYNRKYVSLREHVRETYTYNRIGFKDYDWRDAQIEVEELEKFKNGYSRLRIKKFTYHGNGDAKSKEKMFYKDFVEIQETSNWKWLERDETIQEVRQKKFERILKNI